MVKQVESGTKTYVKYVANFEETIRFFGRYVRKFENNLAKEFWITKPFVSLKKILDLDKIYVGLISVPQSGHYYEVEVSCEKTYRPGQVKIVINDTTSLGDTHLKKIEEIIAQTFEHNTVPIKILL